MVGGSIGAVGFDSNRVREIAMPELSRWTVVRSTAMAARSSPVVATTSARNPVLGAVLAAGLDKRGFAAIWIDETAATWGAVLGTADRTPLNAYTRSDACGAAETWAQFLGKKQEDLKGIGVYGDPGLAEAVRRDPLAVGFNNVNFAYDAKTLTPVAGLAVGPLDLDRSGALEPAERVYATRDDLTRAIAAGVYPAPPARDLYFVVKGAPSRPLLADFLEWVLVEGQRYVAEMGYIAVGPDRIAAGLAAVRGGAGK